MTEFQEAFNIVWHSVMTDLIREARLANPIQRDRYTKVIDALINAYPIQAGVAMEPETIGWWNELCEQRRKPS